MFKRGAQGFCLEGLCAFSLSCRGFGLTNVLFGLVLRISLVVWAIGRAVAPFFSSDVISAALNYIIEFCNAVRMFEVFTCICISSLPRIVILSLLFDLFSLFGKLGMGCGS